MVEAFNGFVLMTSCQPRHLADLFIFKSWARTASVTVDSSFVTAVSIVHNVEISAPAAVIFGLSSGAIEARNAWTLEPMPLPSINFRKIAAFSTLPLDNVLPKHKGVGQVVNLAVSAGGMEIYVRRRGRSDLGFVLDRIDVFDGIGSAIGQYIPI